MQKSKIGNHKLMFVRDELLVCSVDLCALGYLDSRGMLGYMSFGFLSFLSLLDTQTDRTRGRKKERTIEREKDIESE